MGRDSANMSSSEVAHRTSPLLTFKGLWCILRRDGKTAIHAVDTKGGTAEKVSYSRVINSMAPVSNVGHCRNVFFYSVLYGVLLCTHARTRNPAHHVIHRLQRTIQRGTRGSRRL